MRKVESCFQRLSFVLDSKAKNRPAHRKADTTELPSRPKATASNLVWAIDFKGDFFLGDHTRVYPSIVTLLGHRCNPSPGHGVTDVLAKPVTHVLAPDTSDAPSASGIARHQHSAIGIPRSAFLSFVICHLYSYWLLAIALPCTPSSKK